MSYTAKIFGQSATRALGVLINKFKAHGRMPYETYTKLFYSLVQPVLEYAAPVWAYRDHSCISAVQHKAGRFFLGVGRYTPSSAVLGDLGWLPVQVNLWINLIREWCRLHALDSSRLNYKIFRYALEQRVYFIRSNSSVIMLAWRSCWSMRSLYGEVFLIMLITKYASILAKNGMTTYPAQLDQLE